MRALAGRRMPRRLAIALAATGLGVAPLAACAPGPSAPHIVTGTGPITFAIGELDTGSYLPALLQQWNAAHPYQSVTLIPLPNQADDQHAQLVANLQTRSSIYDVMSLDVIWTAEFAANGWIVPLSANLFPRRAFLSP